MSTAEVIIPDSVALAEKQPEVVVPKRDAHGRLMKGSTANPGGMSRKFHEIQKLLNREHRNIENVRDVFNRLRALAMGETILVPYVNEQGEFQLKAELKADARFMQLYLDRLLGPAKAFDEDMDLTDAPQEVIEYLRIKVMKK